MKVQPEEVIASMEQLSEKLSHNHPNSETARRSEEHTSELQSQR